VNNNSIVIVLLSYCYLISGCSLLSKPSTIEFTSIDPVVCNQSPKADALTMFQTPPNAIKDEFGIWWFAFDAKAYENISKNIQSMRQYMTQQRKIIKYYRKCIEDQGDTTDASNSD